MSGDDVAIYFLDTSAAVKRYVREVGTAWISDLYDPSNGHEFYLSRIAEVELTAALARRRRQASLTPAETSEALDQFLSDLNTDFRVIELTIPLLKRAASLADRHAIRAYDAVQLASALEARSLFPSLILISADNDLNTAALSEAMTVENPNSHP